LLLGEDQRPFRGVVLGQLPGEVIGGSYLLPEHYVLAKSSGI
jgi:hypothetical protein